MPATPVATVVGIGEVLWDCFGDDRRPGGAPANVAFHARQLGLNGLVCSRVGNDPLGDELVGYLAQQDIDTQYIQRDAEHPTGTVTVDASNPTDPRYVIHENVAWDFLQFDARLEQLMQQAQAVCFGTLAQRHTASRETIYRCLEAVSPSCLVVYDVNVRQSWYDRHLIDRSLRQAEVVKLNHEEVTLVAGLLDMPAEPIDFARWLIQHYDLTTVCVTRGEHGCLLLNHDEVADVPGVRVDVVDTVGAGDSFTAALIAAHLRRLPLQTMGRFANEVAALVASRPGGMPVLADSLPQLKQEYLGSG